MSYITNKTTQKEHAPDDLLRVVTHQSCGMDMRHATDDYRSQQCYLVCGGFNHAAIIKVIVNTC